MAAKRVFLFACLIATLLLQGGCWQRIAIARGVQRVQNGDGPVGQVVNDITDGDDDSTDTSGPKTSATTSGATSSGAY